MESQSHLFGALFLRQISRLQDHQSVPSTAMSLIGIPLNETPVRFFPHEIADLTIALEFMNLENGLPKHKWLWSMRYATLLWLYIICVIPFDLAQFDEPDNIGGTARALQDVAKRHLGASGLEREAAALLLSRLYMRCVDFLSLMTYLDLTSIGRIQA